MRMSINSYNGMNILLQKCFNANSVIDNLAYNLDYFYYNQVAAIVHKNVAHVMPEWADMVSDKMLELSARPVRKDINGYEQEYKDLPAIFEVLNQTIVDIRNYTRGLIESSDMDGDDEVRIFCEDFVNMISPFVKQTEEWIDAVKKLDPNDFNIHIECYTHFINK